MSPKPWRVAMAEALYGDDGFFRRPQARSDHFRTSAHTGPVFARAIMRVLIETDRLLDHPDRLDLIGVGAGRGELLMTLNDLVDDELRARLAMTAIEVSTRPAALPAHIGWTDRLPARVTGLLVAGEWLDNVPVDVAGRDPDGRWRYVLVDTTGIETLGDPVSAGDADWLSAWWPDGYRAEIGRTRDEAWADAVARLDRGVALTMDYGHVRDDRPPLGSLTAFRDGREVQPVPDGSCDLTAHVAMDAAASAVAGPSHLVRQADALRALGVSGRRPPLVMAHEDPGGYVRALAAAGVAAELTDRAGLGGHYWLWHPIAVDLAETTMIP